MPIQSKQQPPYYQIQNARFQYLALLLQSGTNAPVATILQNTYPGTPVWTRASTGLYNLTLTGYFTTAKTAILFTSDTEGVIVSAAVDVSPNSIYITTRNVNSAPPPVTVYTDDAMGGNATILIYSY